MVVVVLYPLLSFQPTNVNISNFLLLCRLVRCVREWNANIKNDANIFKRSAHDGCFNYMFYWTNATPTNRWKWTIVRCSRRWEHEHQSNDDENNSFTNTVILSLSEPNPIQNNGCGVLSNKLSKLTLATFDESGRCIGQMGSLSISYWWNVHRLHY